MGGGILSIQLLLVSSFSSSNSHSGKGFTNCHSTGRTSPLSDASKTELQSSGGENGSCNAWRLAPCWPRGWLASSEIHPWKGKQLAIAFLTCKVWRADQKGKCLVASCGNSQLTTTWTPDKLLLKHSNLDRMKPVGISKVRSRLHLHREYPAQGPIFLSYN